MEEKRKHEHCCISHEFLDAATRNPNKIAVIHASGACGTRKELIDDSSSSSAPQNGDQCFTFADILSSVDSLSSRLRSILDGADDRYLIKPQTQGSNYDEQAVPVRISQQSIPFAEHGEQPSELNIYKPKILGIYMPPCCEYIITVLSVLRCGEAFLPLDPSWPKERILSIVSSSSTDLVVACGPSFGASGSQPLDKSHWLIESGNCPILCFSMEESVKEHICASSFAWPCKNEKQRAFCYLLYTSGSTGRPKGVCGTEQGLLNRFLWMQELYPLHGEELLLFKTSTSFIDHLQEFLGAVLTACTLVIPPFAQLKENIFSIVDFIQAYSISRLIAVPSLMRAILPALQEQEKVQILSSLKLLILSGEVLPLYLWDMLSYLLPETSILNLYGSTEVSGDCTYFDSKRLPKILETENLTSVPIGMPISNCDVVLVGEVDEPDEGEIYVGGLCISYGYLYGSIIRSLDHVKLHENSVCSHSANDCGSRIYFKTGDFGRRLPSGELIFLGRKDRTIKVNGHRIALEEIESTLRQHSNILDAAVISSQGQEDLALLEAFIVLKEKAESNEILRSSIRKWMIERLPLAVIPNRFVFMESLPMSSSGKVDFESLASLTYSKMHVQDAISEVETSDILQVIKKAFCNALMVEEISDDDDFFMIGGNSIAAAHVSYNLGIDMRLLYNFPSPSELTVALLEKKGLHGGDFRIKSDWNVKLEAGKGDIFESVESAIPALGSPKRKGLLLRTTDQKNNNRSVLSKRLKMDSDQCVGLEYIGLTDGYKWNLPSIPMSCSFSRCNRVVYGKEYKVKDTCQMTWSVELPGNRSASMQELWKVHMESCVDASPLVVFKESDVYLFIGSHSHNFLCVNANSGKSG